MAQVFWSLKAPDVKQIVPLRNATAGELVEVGALPTVWEVARVIWSELTFEWPDGVVDVPTELVVVRETLHGHVTDVLADLRELGMGGHEIAFVSWNVDVCVVIGFQEVERVGVALEGVKCEVVSGIDTISEPFEASGCGWNKVRCNRTDLRDAEQSVIGSSERASEWVVMEVVELEKSNDTSRVDDFDSIWWHLITNVIEREVDILEEE